MKLQFIPKLSSIITCFLIVFNEMVALWQELVQCYDDIWESANDYTHQKKREERMTVFTCFLQGLIEI